MATTSTNRETTTSITREMTTSKRFAASVCHDVEESLDPDGVEATLTPVEDEEQTSDECTTTSPSTSWWTKLRDFYSNNMLSILILFAICLAKAYPPLGAVYLQPQITATWIAVCIIFLISGLGLRTSEFGKVIFHKVPFNIFIQVFNFGVVSAVVFGVSRLLVKIGILNSALADGMVICSALPMAINVVIVLTTAAGGDEAASVFHATFGNIIGIFLSPVLILMYLPGASGSVNLVKVFEDLTIRVVLPLVIGQVIQKFWTSFRAFYLKHKRKFKRVQELSLVFIVYTVFCRTFLNNEAKAGVGNVFLMILYQFLLMTGLMAIAWFSLKFLFPDEPELRVMGLFGSVQKTVALGVPLIGSIYGGNINEGLYTLPILVWHPMQLIVGSLLVSRLSAFVVRERERLGPIHVPKKKDEENDDRKTVHDDLEHSPSQDEAEEA